MTRIAVTGAAGRMGRTLIQNVHETAGLTLAAAFERADSSLIGVDVGELSGIGNIDLRLSSDISAELDNFDTLIDFSVPDATLAAVAICAEAGKRLVIGTTGFDDTGLASIRAAAAKTPVLMAPNMSVGVNLCFKLIELAARVLGDEVDVEITEAHHRHKIDAPSGTALEMGEILSRVLDRDLAKVAVFGRKGTVGERDRSTIGFSSLRGGDIVGDHTVLFAGSGERLEITHRASSRSNFAQGAIRAARFLENHANGLFDMQDVLGFNAPVG
ncbi:MAG: 4-hydroxy-tetrahydrodipicolinate reductase [Gammaproteobacteria bacterium]|nr:4-hydroxy-tetrahydrodipicolinate reductase [Gammaproteobacteria bacterium]